MKQWIYKATESKIGYYETLHLAVQKHFLCRSSVEINGSHADRVREVDIGDIIHFYYKRNNKPVSSFGSFLVVDGCTYKSQFGERVEGTALFNVLETPENADLIRKLTEEHQKDPTKGYTRDPAYGCFTGWVIQRLPPAQMSPPPFAQDKLFPGPMFNLWSYPDPSLPRKRVKGGASQ